jgi:hypothetical protein
MTNETLGWLISAGLLGSMVIIRMVIAAVSRRILVSRLSRESH